MQLLFDELAKKNGSQLFHIEEKIMIDSIPNIQIELKEIFVSNPLNPPYQGEDKHRRVARFAICLLKRAFSF